MSFLRDMLRSKKSAQQLKQTVRVKYELCTSPIHISDEQPTGPVSAAFKEYVNNDIPARLIDTSKMQFVSRKDVFNVFQDKIASITDAHIQERIRSSQSDPLATYQPRRETVIRQIIQEVVKYVILSHRWDEVVGEPTYQDVSGGKKHAAIFKKLIQFCKVSTKLGHKLAWIDTCCIDKTNAAELGEAIHGMYKWYANSYLCIVHLAESTSYVDWVNESWFRRGWTLQELLAPKRVKFYDKNWQPFAPPAIEDDRKFADVLSSLSSITNISKTVLTADNSQGVQGCTFWEIMSWASKRETTRIEDRAYSLIGLFRVSLTVTYGEGELAFSRLVEVIAAKNPSWHIFTWFGQPSRDHFALAPSPAAYPMFEALMACRTGVQEFAVTSNGLSLRSLPPVPMEVSSVIDPDGAEKPFLVHLKPRPADEISLGRYGTVIVKCGATRLKTILEARHLSACILNHHGVRSRERGELVLGEEYICLLLFSEDGEDDEMPWMKLHTDNLLRISFVGLPRAISGDSVIQEPGSKVTRGVSMAGPKSFTLPLETISIRSPTST